MVTVRDGRGGHPDHDLVLDFGAGTAIRELTAPLLAALGDPVHPSFAARVAVWIDGVRADPEADAADAGLRDGSLVSVHEPGPRPPGPPPPGPQLRVVAGPGAGRVHALAVGRTLVGCGASGFSLADVQVPADGLAVARLPGGAVEVTRRIPAPEAGGRDGGGGEDPGPTEWPVGEVVRAGSSVLQLVSAEGSVADVRPSADGAGLDFNRPPRLLPPVEDGRVSFPVEPAAPPRRAFPWLVVLAPMALAIPMALLSSPRFLLFAFMSPAMMVANVVNDRRAGGREHRQRLATYRERLAAAEAERERLLTAEERQRRAAHPDPAELLLTAVGPGPRLWERRRTDADYLALRLGSADRPARLTVGQDAGGLGSSQAAPAPGPATVREVPVTLDLRRLAVVGLAGEPDAVHALASWLLGQAAVLHSPRDLRLVVLTGVDPQAEQRWGWLRWVPHARSPEGGPVAQVGNDQDSVGRRLAELSALVSERTAQRGTATGGRWHPPGPDVVVVLEGARRLRLLPAVVTLLRDGPQVGVYVLCLDAEERALPEECQAVVSCAGATLTLRASLAEPVGGITADAVEPAWARWVARALAPIRDAGTDEGEDGALPTSARLLSCLALDPPSAQGVARAWAAGPRTDVVIGVGFDGGFRVDLRRDGPHALVAGTTGSGKSEFLQTLVAALAVANRPDALTFVLVDYKGGSAFKDCARLPHTVGMVTDLDAHLVSRALTSLGAELRRREHLLAGAGAKDLEDYDALRSRDGALPAVPRLVIVIDEFAGLAAELPDFVHGLVGIAQRGRSLGIHLVLATQRPSGVVSPEIRANTALRVCLRVTDEAESRDVLDAPDAGRIPRTTPGRGLVRTGHSSLLPFQAGRVGGRRPGAEPVGGGPPLVWPVAWESLGAPAPQRPRVTGELTDEGDTDLSDLVAAVTAAARSAGIARLASPWLPPLPEVVTVADLVTADLGSGAGSGTEQEPAGAPEEVLAAAGRVPAVAWGLQDVPAEQAQRASRFELGSSGHLYVVGGPRSGRSAVLRTVITALADRVATRDLHVYGLDCGNGALMPLEALPHCGAVVPRTATERADRLLRRIGAEVRRRQDVLAAGGFADLGEQRAAAAAQDRLPYLVLALDRWEGFAGTLGELDGGRLGDDVMTLLREGASAGVHLLISGDRSLLSGRMGALVEHKLLLRLPDRGDYALANVSSREVPENLPPGRGIWADSAAEVQVAVLDADVSGAGQAEAVRRVGARAARRDAGTPVGLRPFRLGMLPARVPAAQALDLLDGRAPLWLPLGIGGDDLELLGIDLSASPVAVVAGPPRSGRTAVLRFALAVAAARGARALVVSPRGGQLAAEASAVFGEASVCTGTGGPAERLVGGLRALPPQALVLVDDAELLRDGELVPVLLALVRQAREKHWGVVVAGESAQLASGLTGWLFEARRGRQGLLLSPQSVVDGEAVGARITRGQLSAQVLAGRGLLVGPGAEPVAVQVPLVAGADR